MMKLIFLALSVLLLLLLLCDQHIFIQLGADLAGRVVGHYDGLQGNMKVIECDVGDCVGAYATDHPAQGEYVKLLQNRYRIKYKLICSSTNRPFSNFKHSWKTGYMRGYNTVSILAIEEKFGEGVVWRTEEESRKIYTANNPVR